MEIDAEKCYKYSELQAKIRIKYSFLEFFSVDKY